MAGIQPKDGGPFCVHSCFPWGAFATHAGSNRMYGTFRTSNRRRDGTSHPWHAEIGKEGTALLLGSGPTSRVSLVLVQQPTSLPTVVGSCAAQTEKVFKVVKAGMQVLARVTVRGSPSMFWSHGLFWPYYGNQGDKGAEVPTALFSRGCSHRRTNMGSFEFSAPKARIAPSPCRGGFGTGIPG